MKSALLFNFTVNKTNNTITIKREFDADRPAVWRAFTTAELLDQWWGPAPWRAETKSLNFSEGGQWLYAMVSPEGQKHWSCFNYLTIVDENFFSAKDGFCDENGTINEGFPQTLWENNFTDKDDHAQVEITLSFQSLADLEKIIQMGFKEGITAGLNQLDALLAQTKN